MAGAYSTRRRATCMPSPRLVQKHSRLLAVLETMDNGKPIRESRDIDIPLVARHFYYHAVGRNFWSRNFRSTFLAESSDKLFRGTFAAHARVENRSRAGDGQYGGFEPAEFTR